MYRSLPVLVGSHYRSGYLARPDQAGRFPTVLLVPHLGSLRSHEKSVARRLARLGVAVLAIDLHEPGQGDPQAAYQDLADEAAMRVIDEAYEWIRSDDNPWSQSERIGLLGIDVGGRFALAQAAHRDWVASAAVVATPLTGDEGRRYQVADMLEHLAVPVLGLYGAEDQLIPTDSVDEAQRRNGAGSWLLYAGSEHSFFDEGAEGYNRDAAEDAITRLAEFFEATLPKAEEVVLG